MVVLFWLFLSITVAVLRAAYATSALLPIDAMLLQHLWLIAGMLVLVVYAKFLKDGFLRGYIQDWQCNYSLDCCPCGECGNHLG